MASVITQQKAQLRALVSSRQPCAIALPRAPRRRAGVVVKAAQASFKPRSARRPDNKSSLNNYENDHLTHSVSGVYEWQLFYMWFALCALFSPFIPGVTAVCKAIYESFGGQLL
mmetsp:Transcript_20073/g.43738  ORF Transcript_20073/g.43738 Transcript_20073/m.43738 type:complete len:114 (-) Transcript_20073:523-864(-)|eukprot:CAMPEP_0202901824 /NCGR_PEP_ID=MMETSP1392-20130828/14851_1 /ASSEMBLY_ACC=CAM_ASM_000868 /TAXON_ID=225041 /ORGANISM="Chlamydomonas chlamydogama, Strain SAG 11-48b" /LENGTH=113 /DNA_ID=CAMNT_0049588451 /DNA_START=128 /DNA_END=469 /DNA_ORIENTATION=+